MNKKWTMTHTLMLASFILSVILGIGNWVKKNEIKINYIQEKIKKIDIIEAKIKKLDAEEIKAKTLKASESIEVGGEEQSHLKKGLIINNSNDFSSLGNFQVKGKNDNNIIFGNSKSNNVGIGTSEPKTKLDVIGAASISDTKTGNALGNNLCIDINNSLCVCGFCKE